MYWDASNPADSCSYVSTTKLGSAKTVIHTCFPKALSSVLTREYWLFQGRRQCANLMFRCINFFRKILWGITSFQALCCSYGKSILARDFIILESHWFECRTEGGNAQFSMENTSLGCLWQHSQGHGMVWVGRNLKDYLVPAPSVTHSTSTGGFRDALKEFSCFLALLVWFP